MFLLLVLAAGLCLYGISFHNSLNIQYLGKEETNAVKGLFVLLVFFAHVVQYIHFNDTMADKLFDFIMGLLGQNIVIAFLLYSGYGIGRAYMARGGGLFEAAPQKPYSEYLVAFCFGGPSVLGGGSISGPWRLFSTGVYTVLICLVQRGKQYLVCICDFAVLDLYIF